MNTVNYWLGRKSEPYSDTSDIAYALPIIIDTRDVTHDHALLASAQAVARFLTQEETINSPLLQPWLNSNIRKVVRRVKDEKSWTKAESLPGLTTEFSPEPQSETEVRVRVLLPHNTSEVPTEIKRLQVSGLELPSTPVADTMAVPHSLNIVVNPDLPMSTGKIMAQTGHIAQLALSLSSETEVMMWAEAGFPVRLSSDWNKETQLVIHDAGYTEIPAGSPTVKAYF